MTPNPLLIRPTLASSSLRRRITSDPWQSSESIQNSCYVMTVCLVPRWSGEPSYLIIVIIEWAVFVDKRGFRARGEWKAVWEGRPTAFGEHHGHMEYALVLMNAPAFHYPYVIAFEPGFIEVWDIITCRIQQVIPSDNLRCLFAEPPPSGSHPPPPSMYYHPHSMPHPPHQHPPGPVQYNVHPNGPISHYPPVPQQTFPPGPPMHQNHPMIPQQHLQGIPPQQPVVPGFSPGYGSGRREILLVSDDNVMFLKRAFPSQSSADGAPMSGPTPT